MTSISQRELRNESGRVLRDVEAGATFEVTVAGRVVARLVPAGGRRSRVVDPASLREVAARTPVDGTAWTRDVDAAFDDEMDDDPWRTDGPGTTGPGTA